TGELRSCAENGRPELKHQDQRSANSWSSAVLPPSCAPCKERGRTPGLDAYGQGRVSGPSFSAVRTARLSDALVAPSGRVIEGGRDYPGCRHLSQVRRSKRGLPIRKALNLPALILGVSTGTSSATRTLHFLHVETQPRSYCLMSIRNGLPLRGPRRAPVMKSD